LIRRGKTDNRQSWCWRCGFTPSFGNPFSSSPAAPKTDSPCGYSLPQSPAPSVGRRPSNNNPVDPWVTNSQTGLVKKALFHFCIYTIRQSGVLADILKQGGSGSFKENKKWSTGRALFEQAMKADMLLPVVFAAGESVSGLIFWAVIDSLEIESLGRVRHTTTFRFVGLRPIKSRPRLSSLKLRRTGKQLSDEFIRP
jgi:hypothetical protein